jgi:hypothetical protein
MTPNRTIVELKSCVSLVSFFCLRTPNRTIVELKSEMIIQESTEPLIPGSTEPLSEII